MKTIFFTFVLTLAYLFTMAQEPDTTKIRMGNNKILIIKNQDEKKANMNRGISDFKAKISELNDSIAQLRASIANSTVQEGDNATQLKMQEYEKKIAAYESGIQQIESELQEMESAMNEEDDDDDNDSFDFDAGDWDFGSNDDDENPKFDGGFGGFSFGPNFLVNSDFTTSTQPGAAFMELNNDRSWYFQFNPIEFNVGLYKDLVGLTTGLGFEWNYYAFDNNIKLMEDANGIMFGQDMPDRKYTKNHLRVVNMNVPLLFEVQLPIPSTNTRIVLGGGGFGSLKLHSRTKQYYKENGSEYKDKMSDDFQINPLRYGVMAYVGFRNIRLTASYSIVPFFKDLKGPELYPINIGFTIGDF